MNKNGTGKEAVDNIKIEHDKIFEYNEKGKVAKVKFESDLLKYDLDDLFKNHASFYEPIP